MKGLTRGPVGALALLVAVGAMAIAGGPPPRKGGPPARKGGPPTKGGPGRRDDRRGPGLNDTRPGDRDRPTRPDAQGVSSANTPDRPDLDGKGGDVAHPHDKGFKESLPDDINSRGGPAGVSPDLPDPVTGGGWSGITFGGTDTYSDWGRRRGLGDTVHPFGGGTHRLDGKGGDISSLDGKGNDMSSLDGKGNDLAAALRRIAGREGADVSPDASTPFASRLPGGTLSGQGQGITAEDDWESPTALTRNWHGHGLYGWSGVTFDASLRPRLGSPR
ncbi:MAG TPA: hypothetical protein VNE39_06770 [Planctomycetota bacterium]|nr:hypothetical protein [Planctomycetota bacterium]